LQWHDAKNGDYPNDRPSYRFVVNDVSGLHHEFLASGISEMTPVEKSRGERWNFTFETTKTIFCNLPVAIGASMEHHLPK
jgi:hypothetical protein